LERAGGRQLVEEGLLDALEQGHRPGEEDVERPLERSPVGRALHHRRPEDGPERLAISQVDEGHRARCIEQLGRGNPDAVLAQHLRELDDPGLHDPQEITQMARIFLAGASGAIGQPLVSLLVRAGHRVTGSTRTPEKAELLARLGATPLVVDVFEAAALMRAVVAAASEIVIQQLTNLPDDMDSLDQEGLGRALRANARMRSEGTPNLVAA